MQDYLAGWVTSKQAKTLYNSARITASKNIRNEDQVFVWNGSRTLESAVVDAAKENGNNNILYFENANIKGKVFVDPLGVNAKSKLYNDVKNDNNQFVCDDLTKYETWRIKYIQQKLKVHIVQQSIKNRSLSERFIHYLDKLGFMCGITPISEPIINNKSKINTYYETKNIPSGVKFVFFPLQVVSDSQVLLNSNVNLQEALIKAYEISEKKGLALVIKPHPAETETDYIGFINDFSKQSNCYLMNDNTFEMIKNSNIVVTVNSTVGLEAKLMGKNVITLGRALYSNFTDRELAGYLEKFLINIDYFSDQKITAYEYNQIINRINKEG
ncbi:hypothetical protein WNY51_16535 [Pseudocolwellia sp. AS88]|uniref:capsular polysaccharide export protein, LipB/KpsS family n=1 Tax=Pseudocolwellia sp. AS88 TaxID=3063958 RepID=UPI0026EB79BB|nr:hypothetical protein [Pseudocolwellia sp. AS88]